MIKGGFFMKRNRKQGFTLIELIVVIAIIGVLSAILIPSIIGYVKKSKRTADISTAHTIYEGVLAVLADDEDIQDAFIKNNTNKGQVTISSAGSNTTYDLYVVCSKDGAANAGGNHAVWSNGSADALPFEDALNNLMGSGKCPVKYTKSDKGKPLNRWFICTRNNGIEDAEIWVGNGSNDTPMYRLWPNTQSDYN
jgi:prepilin-type N-terminal cleavage/methylation domain-containing protein